MCVGQDVSFNGTERGSLNWFDSERLTQQGGRELQSEIGTNVGRAEGMINE